MESCKLQVVLTKITKEDREDENVASSATIALSSLVTF